VFPARGRPDLLPVTTLHIFDMDGTLLRGTTANLEIARHLGSTEQLVELEARFAAEEIDTRGFSAAIHKLWRDLTPPAGIRARPCPSHPRCFVINVLASQLQGSFRPGIRFPWIAGSRRTKAGARIR
jgi:hypothetical protein